MGHLSWAVWKYFASLILQVVSDLEFVGEMLDCKSVRSYLPQEIPNNNTSA